MTWVEVMLMLSAVTLIGAIFVRPLRIRRTIQALAGLTLVVMLAIFGREIVGDLF